jgi:hypothetical protein
MELASLSEGGDVRFLGPASVDEVAADVNARGARWVWVEGFSGAGKSHFAIMLAHALSWRQVDLDGLVLARQRANDSYAHRMALSKLKRFLGTPDLRSHVVVHGVCLRDVMTRVGDTEPGVIVYIAKVSKPTATTICWHDGLWLEEQSADLDWLTSHTIDYHRRVAPYRDAHHVFLRLADT